MNHSSPRADADFPPAPTATGPLAPGPLAPGPLAGWRVLVPRPPERSTELVDLLTAAGATPVAVPLISIEPAEDDGALDLRLVALASGEYAWLGFTSAAAVDAVLRRAGQLGLHPAVPADTRVAAVGPATGARLRAAGLPVDLQPPTGGSADALAAIWPHPSGDAAVLLPRSDIAAPALPRALSAMGYRVDAVTAYRTVVQPVPQAQAAELSAGAFDAVLFTSPSTVQALNTVPLPPSTVLCAIGRPTTAAAVAAGRPVHLTAAGPTAPSLVDALVRFAADHPRNVKA